MVSEFDKEPRTPRTHHSDKGDGLVPPDEVSALDLEALIDTHADTFSKALIGSMNSIIKAFKDEQAALKDDLIAACMRGPTASQNTTDQAPETSSDLAAMTASAAIVPHEKPWLRGVDHSHIWRGAQRARLRSVPGLPRALASAQSSAESLSLHELNQAWRSNQAPAEVPEAWRSHGATAEDHQHVHFMPSFEVPSGADTTTGLSSYTPARIVSPTPNRQQQTSTMQHVSTVILQRHLREVQLGGQESEPVQEVARRRRKSITDVVHHGTVDNMRGYLRRQRCKDIYSHRKERRQQSLLATVLEVLLRPANDREQVDTPLLDFLMSIVVVINTIIIGVSTDVQRSWGGWFLFDTIFAICYLVEFLLKMIWVGCHRYFRGQDALINTFDFVLLILAWIEVGFVIAFDDTTSGTNLLQLVRLARIIKVLRVCRLGMFADMLMMINGAIGSFKTLLYSIFLITLPLYVVSLFFHELLREHSNEGLGAEEFETLALSIFNIFRCIIANECANPDGKPIFSRVVSNYGWGYGLVYCFTVTFMTFGLFNVIVAIYVENIVTAAKLTARRSKRKRLLDHAFFEEKCLECLRYLHEAHYEQHSEDGSGKRTSQLDRDFLVTPELLSRVLEKEEFARLLRELDIADEDMIDLFETLDVNANGEVDAKELIIGLARLRGEFRRSDIIGVSLVLRSMQEFLIDMDARLQASQSRSLLAAQPPRAKLQDTLKIPLHGLSPEREKVTHIDV
mmetsp:Transcript_51600/g.122787  ORF Transcript_51600/g.122787 Transcript_51600/m.122787 type:complete len:738 (+) Transcript_51600:39-2252(+)